MTKSVFLLLVVITLPSGRQGFAQSRDTTGTVRFVLPEDETLYSLASTFRLTVDSLMALNPALPNPLLRGVVIRVPSDRATRRIRVGRGGTLFAIARQYKVSVGAIQRANNMTNSNLRSGQILIIPGQGVTVSSGGKEVDAPAAAPAPLKLIASGHAVVYPETYIDRMMASGQPYRRNRFIISHPDLPIGSIVLVSAPGTGRETFAEIADRGFGGEPLIIDVSEAVVTQLWPGPVDEARLIEIRAVDMAEN